MPRLCSMLLLLGFFGILVGCSDSKTSPISVKGKVNLDGKPLEEGKIAFVGEAGGAPETLEIKGGQFEGSVLPGKKRVEIRAFKLGKKTKMGDVYIEASPENYLPSRFNTETTLQTEVSAEGLKPDTFEVKSK